jgi:hypothetical protein
MKIITRGTPPEDVRYRHTCAHCATVFEFEQREARSVPDPRELGYSIACPLCRRDWYFSSFRQLTKAPVEPVPQRRAIDLPTQWRTA